MDHERQHATIKTLDNFPRVLFWSVDEFVCLAAPLFFGICFGFIYLVPLGFLLKPVYVRIKKKMPKGSFIHRIYWIFPTSSLKKMGVVKQVPPSHYRELIL